MPRKPKTIRRPAPRCWPRPASRCRICPKAPPRPKRCSPAALARDADAPPEWKTAARGLLVAALAARRTDRASRKTPAADSDRRHGRRAGGQSVAGRRARPSQRRGCPQTGPTSNSPCSTICCWRATRSTPNRCRRSSVNGPRPWPTAGRRAEALAALTALALENPRDGQTQEDLADAAGRRRSRQPEGRARAVAARGQQEPARFAALVSGPIWTCAHAARSGRCPASQHDDQAGRGGASGPGRSADESQLRATAGGLRRTIAGGATAGWARRNKKDGPACAKAALVGVRLGFRWRAACYHGPRM